jgi:hypothetical protein
MSVEAERGSRAIDSESLDFLANVMPALDIADDQLSTVTPTEVAARIENLATKVEALAETCEAPADRRLSLFGAALLRAASPARRASDLVQELNTAGYAFEGWQLPIITRETAAWLCDQFVEPIDDTPLARVIQLPVPMSKPEAALDAQPPIKHHPVPESPKETSNAEVSFAIGAESDAAQEPEATLDTDEDLEKLVIELEKEARQNAVDSVGQYLRDIGKRPLLTAEQEVELAKSIEAGLFAQEALDKAEAQGVTLPTKHRRDLRQLTRNGARDNDILLESNLRLVVSLARRYQGQGLELLDLIQEGNTGLIRAVQKFDYEKGFKFSTYATWWIRQAITRTPFVPL